MAFSNSAAYLESPRAHPLIIKPAPPPASPSTNQIVIRSRSVAINPLDCVIQQSGMIIPETAYPFILGNDIEGKESGCFQKYNIVEQNLVTKIPDDVNFTQAGVLPLALCTAAVMLFQQDMLTLDLPKVQPVPNGKTVVVWGGASALGSNAIQMLKAAGYDVVAVAGERNQQYCKDLGADFVLDHRLADVEENIVKTVKGRPFVGVFCPIMAPDTISTCARIAARLGDGPKNRFVATSLAHAMPFEGEVPEGVTIGYCWGDSLKHNEIGPAIWDQWLTPALANGNMQCKPPPEVIGKGLESIQAAIDR